MGSLIIIGERIDPQLYVFHSTWITAHKLYPKKCTMSLFSPSPMHTHMTDPCKHIADSTTEPTTYSTTTMTTVTNTNGM